MEFRSSAVDGIGSQGLHILTVYIPDVPWFKNYTKAHNKLTYRPALSGKYTLIIYTVVFHHTHFFTLHYLFSKQNYYHSNYCSPKRCPEYKLVC